MSATLIRGPRRADNVYVLERAAMRDTRLSRRARGLLAELLTHEPGWQTSLDRLAELGPEGRDALKAAVAELKRYGYLEMTRLRGENGRMGSTVWNVNDYPTEPQADNPPVEEIEPEVENPPVVESPSPQVENQSPGNPPLKKNYKGRDIHNTDFVVEDEINPDVGIDKSGPFRLTQPRQKLVTDAMIAAGQAAHVAAYLSHLEMQTWGTAEREIADWIGIAKAMAHGSRNRRDDVNELLAAAGISVVTEAEWQAYLAEHASQPGHGPGCHYEDSGYCDEHGLRSPDDV